MKNLLKRSAVMLLFAGALLAGCEKREDVIPKEKLDGALAQEQGTTLKFNRSLFTQGLMKSFTGKTTGYGFAIAQNGEVVTTITGGDSRRLMDGHHPYLPTTRQGTAEATQTITALAVLKALETKGMNENAYVWQLLPLNWNIPEANRKITVAHLLSHTSGLKYTGYDYTSLRTTMQTPTTGYGDAYFKNSVVNYHLCRVLLACIVNGAGWYAPMSDNNADEAVSQFYRSYVRQAIFYPAGIPNYYLVDLSPWNNLGPVWNPNSPGSSQTLYYNYSEPVYHGISIYTNYKSGGAGNWYMSAKELALVHAAAESNKIVSAAMLQRMKDKFMGFDGKYRGRHGTYYFKSGMAYDSKFRGINTMIAHFPNNVQLTWNTNSISNDIGVVKDVIIEAYENAWTY